MSRKVPLGRFQSKTDGKGLQNKKYKNTIDLQWKIRPVYNASACENERNGAGARTMGSNGKNNGEQWEEQWELAEIRANAYVRL